MEWSGNIVIRRNPGVCEMTELRVVSIDMFRTLVDLGSVEENMWHMILGDRFSEALVQECADRATNSMFSYLPKEGFISVKQMFAACFAELFKSIGIEYSPDEAADIWAKQHAFCEQYSDSVEFLSEVGKQYPICLASDADDEMLGVLGQIYAFDYIFTSEKLGVYKANADGRFFTAIISHYGIRPEQIIHIGDGRREILSAHKAGMVTCWLNRKGLEWKHDVKPDYEVTSLIEAASILISQTLSPHFLYINHFFNSSEENQIHEKRTADRLYAVYRL